MVVTTRAVALTLLATGMLATGMLVTGCSGGSDQATPAASTSAAATSASSVAAAVTSAATSAAGAGGGGSAEFVAVVREKVPEVAKGRTDAEIAAIATTACTGLRADAGGDALVDTVRSLNTMDAEATDQATARELIKLAIDTNCIDQARRVDEF